MTADDVSEWDSLSHVRLMLTIERVFRIKFTASQVGNLKNVGDLMDLLQSKLG
jgi:acyl carrier protein